MPAFRDYLKSIFNSINEALQYVNKAKTELLIRITTLNNFILNKLRKYSTFYVLLTIACIACNNEEDEDYFAGVTQITIQQLQKVWYGSYEGWDSLMNAKTLIQKQLELNPDGSYTNNIGGIIYLPNSLNKPKLFEKEAGTYEIEINDTICNLIFTVLYDSLVDFGTSSFIGYQKKHYVNLSGEELEKERYLQSMSICRGNNGEYRLCAVDSMIYSLDGKGPVVYYLNIQSIEP